MKSYYEDVYNESIDEQDYDGEDDAYCEICGSASEHYCECGAVRYEPSEDMYICQRCWHHSATSECESCGNLCLGTSTHNGKPYCADCITLVAGSVGIAPH